MSGATGQVLAIMLEEIGKMWWFFLLSVLLVGVIKGYKLDLRIRDQLVRHGLLGILIAVGVGLVSPLCACGILPVVITLAMVGTPLPALIALLISSPVMGPDAFLITWQGLGSEWAWLKLGGATFIGITTGLLVLLLQKSGFIPQDAVKLQPVFRDDGTLAPAAEIGRANHISVKTMQIVPRANRLRFILDRSWDAALFTGKYLLLAIFLEALMLTFIPTAAIKTVIGSSSLGSLALAALIGLPLPTSQIPMVPILAGLLNLGIDKGAAYTLLMAGPASSLPAIIALSAMFHRRVLATYIGSALGGSFLLGLALQLTG